MGKTYRFYAYFALLFGLFIGSAVVLESCKGKTDSDVIYEETDEEDYTTDEEIYDEFFESDEEEASQDGGEGSEVEVSYEEEGEAGYEEDFSFEASDEEKASYSQAVSSTNVSPKPKKVQASAPARAKSSSTSGGGYLVVAGSYLIKDNAQKMIDKLKNLGYSGAEMVNFDEGKYHSITAGRYTSYDAASDVAAAIKNKGIDCYVHTRK